MSSGVVWQRSVGWMLLLVAATLAAATAQAQMTITVEPELRVESTQGLSLTSNSAEPISIGPLTPGDRIQLNLTTQRGQKYVVEVLDDAAAAQRMAFLQSFKGPFADEKIGRYIPFPQTYTVNATASYTVIIIGTGWWMFSDTVNFSYSLERTLTPTEQEDTRLRFGGLARLVNGMFEFPAFNARIGNCYKKNAFSDPRNGDITYCNELLGDIGNNLAVRDGIFFHELGHSLLQLWGLRGANDENTADEFAVFMLLNLRGGLGAARQYAEFFETSSNPWTDAAAIIKGDRHAMGVQRGAFIRTIIDDPDDFMVRWNRDVYPHVQSSQLAQIVRRSGPYQSSDIALAELRRRGLAR